MFPSVTGPTSSPFLQDSSYSSPIPTDSPALPSEEQHASDQEVSTPIQVVSSSSSSQSPVVEAMAAAESVDVVAAPVMKKKLDKRGKVKSRSLKNNNGKKWLGVFNRSEGAQIVAQAQPRFIPYREEYKIIKFRELVIKNLIIDPTNFYLPRRHTNNIEFIKYEQFSDIIIPVINMENCMSRCFHDPMEVSIPESMSSAEASEAEELRRGKVHESFKHLQDESSGHLTDPTFVGGAYVNNYPEIPAYLQINCDAYSILYFPHSGCYLCVVTDGCGPGQHSREAAQIAVAVCIRYIRDRLSKEQTLESLTKVIIDALKTAQQHLIFEPKNPRTTTININLTFTASSGEKYLLVVGLGDTKCYLTYLQNTGIPVTIDLSQNGRPDFDLAESGGALGGFFDYPQRSENYVYPKLGNLSVICCKLPPTRKHYVSTMTDGLTDCLNPELLQFTLRQANSLIPECYAESWNDLPLTTRQKVVVKFATEMFSSIFARAISQSEGNLDRLCNSFIQYTKCITMGSRVWLLANPRRMPPKDDPFYLGKRDHTTMACYMVPSNEGASTASFSTSHTSPMIAGSSSSIF